MAKKKFLCIMNLMSFLLLVLTFGQYGFAFAGSEFLLDSSLYIVSGILCVIAFIFSVIAIYYFFKKESDFFLSISTVVSNVFSFFMPILLLIIHGYADIISMLLTLLFSGVTCLLYFLGKKKFGETNSNLKYHLFSAIFYGFLYLVYLGALGIVIWMIGYFFYAFPKPKRLPFHIIVAFFTVVSFVLFIIELVEEGPLGVFFYAVFGLIYGILYFILNFLKKGKEVLSLFNDNAFMTSTTEKPSSSSTDEIEMLENLYRMKVNGILSEEEFQTQKDKILGGK